MVTVMKYLYYFQVIFFKPKVPMDGQYNTLISNYGVAATPNIEAAFYTDLGARAITAVEEMKKVIIMMMMMIMMMITRLGAGLRWSM